MPLTCGIVAVLLRKTDRFAIPFALIKPSILDTELPVTRLMIFWIAGELLNQAAAPVGMENSLKLWNRLLPETEPPLITLVFPCGIIIELTGRL